MIGQWKMSFGMWGSWNPDDLPDALKVHYKLMYPDGVINPSKSHHLTGHIKPSALVLESITEYFNQYLELKMPFGQKSYVWPSYPDGPEPIRCPSNEAINHFDCRL